jgi:hypothetical protein
MSLSKTSAGNGRCKSRYANRHNMSPKRQRAVPRWRFGLMCLIAGKRSRSVLMRSCLVAVLSVAIFAFGAFAGFVTAPTYDAGLAPTSAVLSDFNGDGIPDLATAGAGEGREVTF